MIVAIASYRLSKIQHAKQPHVMMYLFHDNYNSTIVLIPLDTSLPRIHA